LTNGLNSRDASQFVLGRAGRAKKKKGVGEREREEEVGMRLELFTGKNYGGGERGARPGFDRKAVEPKEGGRWR
jgi:hypothetical protein